MRWTVDAGIARDVVRWPDEFRRLVRGASGDRRAEEDTEELLDGSLPERPNSELARGR
jgi:hypothetical protein